MQLKLFFTTWRYEIVDYRYTKIVHRRMQKLKKVMWLKLTLSVYMRQTQKQQAQIAREFIQTHIECLCILNYINTYLWESFLPKKKTDLIQKCVYVTCRLPCFSNTLRGNNTIDTVIDRCSLSHKIIKQTLVEYINTEIENLVHKKKFLLLIHTEESTLQTAKTFELLLQIMHTMDTKNLGCFCAIWLCFNLKKITIKLENMKDLHGGVFMYREYIRNIPTDPIIFIQLAKHHFQDNCTFYIENFIRKKQLDCVPPVWYIHVPLIGFRILIILTGIHCEISAECFD